MEFRATRISSSLAAAAGLPNLKEDLLKGYGMNGTNFKVHLDGYNNLDYWTGKSPKSARREMFYYDETDLMAVRVGRVEDAHRSKAERPLVGPKILPERSLRVQFVNGSHGRFLLSLDQAVLAVRQVAPKSCRLLGWLSPSR